MVNSNFSPQDKKPGDLILSADWNAAMSEIKRLEKAKLNREGADTFKGTLTIQEALNVTGDVKISGTRLKSADGLGILETNKKDWLRINPDENYPAIALYKPVAIGTGGLAIGEWEQLPQGVLKVTQSTYLATAGGNVGIGTNSPKAKLDIEGNAILGYASDITNFGSPLKSGFYQNAGQEIPGDVPDTSHAWTHLITARHSNTAKNHQLQISASYSSNDRLFFRKIAVGLETSNPNWNELATRGSNTFSGNQIFVNDSEHLQLQRSRSETGGKKLFLELVQNDSGPPQVPECNPCIRFHHGSRYWHRIEGSGNGLHFKDGDLNVDNYINVYAKDFIKASDSSLKENVSNIEGILDRAMELKPINFTWKFNNTNDIGFVAQDVEQIFPELVKSTKIDQEGMKEIKCLSYSSFGVIAIAAIQELKKAYDEQIKTLEAKVAELCK